ncbi:MAG: flavin reductase family protein [Schleiferiaceae bacterium]|nr:flavin reductase family protein [Schleiferiaceae bacterium]
MLKIEPGTIPTPQLHGYLLGAVAPRPIALASTVDESGNPNLSPFSFFNVFSANPPIAIFSPARRGRNNTTKDTFENVKRTREVVINVVNHDLVQQASLSSTEYATGVNEFVKAGLTPISSDLVKPHRVQESPVQLECKVRDVVELGNEGGAGNLVICEVVMMHIDENVLGEDGKIDQHKIDLVGRLGKNWYVRGSGEALFEVEKPIKNLGVGVDAIPNHIRNSYILSGNDLGKLGNVETIPDPLEPENASAEVRHIFRQHADGMERREALHHYAKELLEKNQVLEAWNVLLTDKLNRI